MGRAGWWGVDHAFTLGQFLPVQGGISGNMQVKARSEQDWPAIKHNILRKEMSLGLFGQASRLECKLLSAFGPNL